MKVLFYNWVDYLDDEGRGGGVSLYQRNLMAALDTEGDIETAFLSAGLSHDLIARAPRWERVRHGPDTDRARRFEIVNSGALSPSHHSFGNAAQISHPATAAAFFDFVARTGPYDVIHFNNLEGLPAEVLTLKARFPGTRVILALHNYYPLCPQVNLWHQERENCIDYDAGRKCAHCLLFKPDERLVRITNALAFNLKKRGIRPGTRVFDGLFRPALGIGVRAGRFAARLRRRLKGAPAPAATQPLPDGIPFAERRAGMVRLINTHCDRVLCVSGQVGAVAARHGIEPKLLETSYIGTAQAEKFATTAPRAAMTGADDTLTLGYLGYMRRDKGFYFLMDALEVLPVATAARIRLVVAAGARDQATMDRLAALGTRLAELRHVDGYSHDGLDDLLADVDVGVVPVLWEDNLPQVAIEMHARHIPLLTSDLGGAQELGNCPAMVFRAGDAVDFHARINAILAGKITPAQYWRDAMVPTSMAEHIAQLRVVYGAPAEAPAPSGSGETAGRYGSGAEISA